jgi:hypothetical protein
MNETHAAGSPTETVSVGMVKMLYSPLVFGSELLRNHLDRIAIFHGWTFLILGESVPRKTKPFLRLV